MILYNIKNEVFLRDNGFNNVISDTHSHNKYTILIIQDTSIIMMPIGQTFNLSLNNKNPLQVYVNGAIQSNIINYNEIIDPLNNTKGIGIDFSPNLLIQGDIIIFEWVIDLNDIIINRGLINCSNNPNFPAANVNEFFKISVAGKIGGNLGINVEVNDMIISKVITPSGDYAAVGSNWNIFNKV